MESGVWTVSFTRRHVEPIRARYASPQLGPSACPSLETSTCESALLHAGALHASKELLAK